MYPHPNPARIIIATTPADGHTVPALPIAAALVERGHHVRWYAGRQYADRIQALGAEYLPMSDYDYSLVGLDGYFPERKQLSGLAKLKYDMTAVFARPAGTHLADLATVLDRAPADLMLGDTALIAGPMLAELGGPPFAAFGISVLGFPSRDVPPFGLGLGPTTSSVGSARNRLLHTLVRRAVFAGMSVAVNEIRVDAGLPARDEILFEYMLHAALYLQLGAPGFEYPQRDLPDHVRFVGPVRPQPRAGWAEPDWWSDLESGKPVIVLNQGTIATDPTELLLPALAALADDDVLVVAVTGGRDPASSVSCRPTPGSNGSSPSTGCCRRPTCWSPTPGSAPSSSHWPKGCRSSPPARPRTRSRSPPGLGGPASASTCAPSDRGPGPSPRPSARCWLTTGTAGEPPSSRPRSPRPAENAVPSTTWRGCWPDVRGSDQQHREASSLTGPCAPTPSNRVSGSGAA